jgi:hypothetical protein
MNQVLNIFRKDARYMWPEVASSFAVLVCFSIFEPKSWVQGYPTLIGASTLSSLFSALLCIAWGTLIIRVVQAERLVGLNQFWTTRPYEWPKLLAAKALFVLVFVYIPFVIAQLYLLVRADLPVAANLGFLVEDVALLSAAILLPFAVFASLTRFFGQAAMGISGVLTLLAVAGASSPTARLLSPQGLLLTVDVLVGAVLAVVLMSQYSRRMMRRSLMIASFVPVLLIATQLLIPGSPLAVHGYAQPSGDTPIAIRFDPNPLRIFAEPNTKDTKGLVLLRVPILLNGIAPGTSFAKQAENITLAGANGYRWKSGWVSDSVVFAAAMEPGPELTYFEMSIPQRVYNNLGGGPVSLGAKFALAELKDMAPVVDPIATAGDHIAGLGVCSLDDSWSMITCLSAYRATSYFAIETTRKLGPCTSPEARLQPVHTFWGWPGGAGPAIRLSPIVLGRLQFQGPEDWQYRARSANLCEGTPISFVEKRLQRRIVVEMPAETVKLSDYASLAKGK